MFTTITNYNTIISNQNWETPNFLDEKYIPSLDGWRAIAVLLVIISHYKEGIESSSLLYKIIDSFAFGNIGVKIFFVLSGFLITTLLIKERVKHGKIAIRKFFIRRFLRIFPVVYIYILTVYLLNEYLGLNLSSTDFLQPILFITNFGFYDISWLLIHTWTLSVEEQYYILWPLLFSYVKNLTQLILLLLLFIPILKVFLYLNTNLYQALLGPFILNASSIFFGSAIALILFNPILSERIVNPKYFKPTQLIIALITLIVISYLSHQGKMGFILLPFGGLICDLSISYLIIYSIYKKNSFAYTLLNKKFIIHIGLISYSLYVWQQLFFIPSDRFPYLERFIYFPFNIIFLLIFTHLSFYAIEKPLKSFRTKLS